MHRTQGDGFILDPVGNFPIYADEDPPGRDATQLRHQEANSFQEEICNVIIAEGISLNAANESIQQMNQLNQAIEAKDQEIHDRIDNLDSDDIANGSSVTGTTVSDALNWLESNIGGNTTDFTKLRNQMEQITELDTPYIYDVNDPYIPAKAILQISPANYIKGFGVETDAELGNGWEECNIVYINEGYGRVYPITTPGKPAFANFSNTIAERLLAPDRKTFPAFGDSGGGSLAAGITIPPPASLPNEGLQLYVFLLWDYINEIPRIIVDDDIDGAHIASTPGVNIYSHMRRVGSVIIDFGSLDTYELYRQITTLDGNKTKLSEPPTLFFDYPVWHSPSNASVIYLPLNHGNEYVKEEAELSMQWYFENASTGFGMLYYQDASFTEWNNRDYVLQRYGDNGSPDPAIWETLQIPFWGNGRFALNQWNNISGDPLVVQAAVQLNGWTDYRMDFINYWS